VVGLLASSPEIQVVVASLLKASEYPQTHQVNLNCHGRLLLPSMKDHSHCPTNPNISGVRGLQVNETVINALLQGDAKCIYFFKEILSMNLRPFF
jgi:hypothetical protein